MRKFIQTITIVLLLIFSLSCEHGIAPRIEPPRTGFSGMITFLNEWPKDVYSTRLVVFRDTIKTASDFSIFNIGFISDTIPQLLSAYYYESDKNPVIPINPGIYKYVCVAQCLVPGISLRREDWRVAGIYYSSNDITKYGQIEITEGAFLKDIDITVDFNNPPIQPPQ